MWERDPLSTIELRPSVWILELQACKRHAYSSGLVAIQA
jgi:hypothetical protein